MIKSNANKHYDQFNTISMVLSFMVVMIHSSYTSFYPKSTFTQILVNDYWCEYLVRFAVPGFFVLAGIKFYHNFTMDQFARKLSSRVRTLLIPYLAWNCLSVIWAIVLTFPIVEQFVKMRTKFSFTLADVVCGLFWFKYIHPLWYMAVLIGFVLLTPVFYALLQKKSIACGAILALYLLHAFVQFPETTYPMFQPGTLVNSAAFYLLGGVLGKYHYDIVVAKRPKYFSAIGFILYVLAVVIRAVAADANWIFIPAIFMGCIGIWLITEQISIKNPKIWATSFFIYPMHTFVLPCVNKLLSFALPRTTFMGVVNTVLGAIITYLICVIAAIAMRRFAPPILFNILNGSRSEK